VNSPTKGVWVTARRVLSHWQKGSEAKGYESSTKVLGQSHWQKVSESPTMHLNGHSLSEKLYWVTTSTVRNRMTQHYKPFKTVRLEQWRSSTGQQLAKCHRNTDLTKQHSPAWHGSITHTWYPQHPFAISGIKIQSGKNLTTKPQLSWLEVISKQDMIQVCMMV